jgi:hypothetical protein
MQAPELPISLLSVLGQHDSTLEEAAPTLLRTARRLNRQLDKLDTRLLNSLSPSPERAPAASQPRRGHHHKHSHSVSSMPARAVSGLPAGLLGAMSLAMDESTAYM